jgi:hypothetical protein
MILCRECGATPVLCSLIVAVMLAAGACCPDCGGRALGVSWASPDDEEEVWGIVRLMAEASGDNGVSSVKFYYDSVDGEHLIGTVSTAIDSIYTQVWYTTDVANGEYTIYAVVHDANGETSQESITLSVANITRADSIPAGTVKMTPANDPGPPQLNPDFSDYWYDPVPLEGPINTAGAEDSAFITPDGLNFYFWFKADVTMEVYEEADDPMSGIHWSQKVDGEWQEPERVFLSYYDEKTIEGAQTVRDDVMWFISVREDNLGGTDTMEWWTAELVDGRWTNWTNAGELFNQEYEVGELHVTADGNEIYFDSQRAGGQGLKDIWVTRKVDGEWQEPESIDVVNTRMSEGWPYISEDGTELWFTRATPGPEIYRSLKVDGEWQEPEKILSSLAGESTLDSEGNIYFTHHWWDEENERAKEADFYVCYRKQ